MSEFGQKVVLSIIDKALIGGLLLILGYYINKTLETYRSKKSLENELAKTKHNKLIDYMDKQLSQFYWPLYIRLHIDQAIWSRIMDKRKDDPLLKEVAEKIENDVILPNHAEITKIIEGNIHLMEANGKLFNELKAYLRHVAVYKAMRTAGCNDRFPCELGEPWPADLVNTVGGAAHIIQKQYDDLLKAVNQ